MINLSLKWTFEYHGPNLVAPTPVVVGELRTEAQVDIVQITHAIQKLWRDAKFEPSELDELLQRHASDGLLMLGVAASVWARAALDEVRGYVLDAGARRDGDVVRLWVGYHYPPLSREAIQLGLQSLVTLMTGQFNADEFNGKIDRLWKVCRQRHPDYQARIVMTAARRRGVPYAPAWGMPRYWRFGEGANSRVLFESSSSDDGHFGARIQGDKVISKRLLTQLGLPTPRFALVADETQIAAAVENVGFPLVTKPIDRGGGKGVSAGIASLEAAVAGFREARSFSKSPILFEAHLQGEDHRLMVVDGKCVAAIRREPPLVVGDGQSTIRQLVERINQGRNARSLVRSGYLRPISLDASAMLHLAGLGLSESSILEDGRLIRVRSNANLSTGGHCVDVTDQLHPHIRAMAESLAKTLNLRMMGADYLTTDISCDPQDLPGGFVEFNTTPGLEILVAAGWSEEQAGALCLHDMLGAIPKVLVVVNASLREAYLAAAQQWCWYAGQGWAARSRAALSGFELAVMPGQPWPGPGSLFGHVALECALVIVSDEELTQHGAPSDNFDRSLVVGGVPPAALRGLLQSISGHVDDMPQDATPMEVVQSALHYLATHGTDVAERKNQ